MQQKTIHRYEIIEKIGEGGMGVVYKARDPRIDRIVAIKTIKFDLGENLEDVQEKKRRFYREAKTSGQLFHQNIVTILDVDEYQDFSYLVMEYVEGETLARRLRGGQPLPEDDAVQIIIQVCDALQYAHEVGIIHRDIKPGNIMLIGQRQVKVADFGLAKMLTSTSANITKTGGIVGTPFYMAPEQIRGEAVDARIDLFASGVVLYECLTGTKPFLGDTISTIIYKILNEDPVCIREFNRDFSPRLDSIIGKILAKNKADRYQTAAEMVTDLRDYYAQAKSLRERTAPIVGLGNDTMEMSRVLDYETSGKGGPEIDRRGSRSAVKDQTEFRNKPAQSQAAAFRPARWALLLIPVPLLLLLFFFWPNFMALFMSSPNHHQTTILPVPSPTPGPPQIAELSSELSPKNGITATPMMLETPSEQNDRDDQLFHEAFLLVTVVPPEATLFLDGNELGTDSQDRKVRQGEHLIEARLDGYETVSQTYTINGSREAPTMLSFKLQPQPGQISIGSEPANARITLNDRYLGTTPLKIADLRPGPYTLTFERTNYQPLSLELMIKPGPNKAIAPKLVPAGYGSMNINALPWATIFVDDQNYQTTPRSIPKIEAGFHTIRLVHPDYPYYEMRIEVPIGENIKIVHDFEKANFGTIQVNAKPFGTVFIDQKLEGETPISRRVTIGKHHVRISHQGLQDQIFEVTVKGGETEKITALFQDE
ncbi:serine/threonine protein kinase [bacterium]|nr:serine/threonine protein kinase [bacterium]